MAAMMAEAPRTRPSATPALAFRPDRLSAPRPRPDPTTLKDDKSHPAYPSDMPCPLPRRTRRVHLSVASPSARPSPNLRRVGVRDFTFEACSGFTRVTACRIAQRVARQLPAQPTTRWVEPSSTGKPRRLGARRVEDGRGGLGHAATLRFPPPLIKPDVRIARIRLSDWFHRAAHGGAPGSVRAAEAASDGKRAQQHRSASVFAAG